MRRGHVLTAKYQALSSLPPGHCYQHMKVEFSGHIQSKCTEKKKKNRRKRTKTITGHAHAHVQENKKKSLHLLRIQTTGIIAYIVRLFRRYSNIMIQDPPATRGEVSESSRPTLRTATLLTAAWWAHHHLRHIPPLFPRALLRGHFWNLA